MSSPRRRVLTRIAGGCAIAAGVSPLPIALAPDSILPLALRWSPIVVTALVVLAVVFARLASWQPASSTPPPAARREALALTSAPHRQPANARPVREVRAGRPRNELPAGGARPVRAALPAAPERVTWNA